MSSLSVKFANGTASTPKDVTLTIRDYIDDTVIPNALVTVTGVGLNFNGYTNSLGQVHVGTLKPGTYQLIISATGYQSSTADILQNDRFTV